jgi:hypothetical protein
MDFLGVLLIIAIIILVYIARQAHPQIGGKASSAQGKDFLYTQQYNELHDVNNVLRRKVYPTDETTNNLTGFLTSTSTDSQNTELFTPRKTYLDLDQVTDEQPAPSEDLKTRVKDRQPYFLREPYIKRHYGQTYYADWRYPLFLVHTDFAIDPAKFIKEHPKEYPSYVIASRTPMPCDN